MDIVILQAVRSIITNGPKDNTTPWSTPESVPGGVQDRAIQALNALCTEWRTKDHDDCPYCALRALIDYYRAT